MILITVDMKLTFRLDPKRLRRWHIALADTLAARAGTQVSIVWNLNGEPLPSAVPLLFALERLVYGLHADDTASATPADLERYAGVLDAPDLVLDCTAGIVQPGARDARTWRITFDGVADETG